MEISGLSPFHLYLQQTYAGTSVSTADSDSDFAKIAAINPIEDVEQDMGNISITSGISAMDAFQASKAGNFRDILSQLVDASQEQGVGDASAVDAMIPQQETEPIPIEETEGLAGSSVASDSSESDSEEVSTQIVTNSDGSRQLEITTQTDPTKMVTSVQLTMGEKPNEYQSAKASNAYEANFMYATA